jgi:hypothetical protein
MTPGLRILTRIFMLLIGIFIMASHLYAAKPIAVVSDFTGDVMVMSGNRILPVTQRGHILANGDHVQTEKGSVRITFQDGAVLQMRPYTSISIQERMEQGGFWFYKTQRAVRRITGYIGKLFFRSGVSKRNNFLQTPTAVCGIRGTEVEVGFDNIQTYLTIYIGSVTVTGNVAKGLFTDPELSAPLQSRVYQQFKIAGNKNTWASKSGKAIDFAKAKVETLMAHREAFVALQRNPDKGVATEAKVGVFAYNAFIAGGKAKVAVEEMKMMKEAARIVIEKAKIAGDAKKLKNAEEIIKKIDGDIQNAQATLVQMDAVIRKAEEAMESQDLNQAKEAADQARNLSQSVQNMAKTLFRQFQEIVPTEDMDIERFISGDAPGEESPLKEELEEELAEEEPAEEPAEEIVIPPNTEIIEDDVYKEEVSPSQ